MITMFRSLFLIIVLSVCFQTNTHAQVINTMYDTLCSGDSRFGYNTTGVYRDTFHIASGDSIRVYNLKVIPNIGTAPLPKWFNTATNGAGGRLPGGSNDLNWEVSTSLAGPYAPAIVMTSPPPNYSPSIWPDCTWISHVGTGNHSGNMYYYYRIDFELPCFDSCGRSFNSDSIFCLTLELLVDNSVYEVFVNNVPQSANLGGIIPVANPYGHVGFQTANKISLALCKGWKRGYNSLIIQTASGCCYAGFLAQASASSPPTTPPVVYGGFDINPVTGMGASADTGCAPYTVDFVNRSVAATTYEWDFGDGSPSVTTTSPTHTYVNPGTYNVTLIARSSLCGNREDTVQKTIRVFDYPVVNLGPDTAICGNQLLLQSSPAITNASYLWSSGATTSHYLATNTGNYWLEVNRYGCVSRDSIVVTMYPDVIVDLGPDKSLCDRDTPFILSSVQPTGTHYLWSNGLSGTQLDVVRSGKYWLEVSMNGCVNADTIYVNIVPTPVINLGADSIICEQFPLTIGETLHGARYMWNTGATTSHISVNTTDDYILEIDLDGCIVQDTIGITAMPKPAIDLGPDKDICQDQTIVLNAAYEGGIRYDWNTGVNTPSYLAQKEGLYYVTVTTEVGCIGNDTILLTYYAKPTILLGDDTTVCEETPLVLKPLYSINEDEITWSNGSTERQIAITAGGIYYVDAINKCGTTSDTINIHQIFCNIWVPNAFTPNGDGINDILRILGNIGRIEDVSFSIFNRWGQEVFHTKNKLQGWDGNYKATPAALATYVYMLEYSLEGQPYMLKGNVQLLR